MKKLCEICGKEFEARNSKVRVCKDVHTRTCCVCGKEFVLKQPYTQKTCSSKCRGIYQKQSGISAKAALKAKQTRIEKYGVENLRDLQTELFRKCKYCGKEFSTFNSNQFYCDDDHYGECPVCGKQVKITDMFLGAQCCSKECKSIKTKQTNQQKYGVDNVFQSKEIQDRSKKTLMDKYGVEHYSQTKEFQEKFKQTCLDKFGTSTPLENDEIKQKLIDTNTERYGGASPTCDPEVKQKMINTLNQKYGGVGVSSPSIHSKIIKTNLDRYGHESPFGSNEIRDKIKKTNLEKYGYEVPSESKEIMDKVASTNLEKYGVPYYCMTADCREASGQVISNINKDFASRLDRLNIQYEFEFGIENRSYDLLLPNLNIVVELNPTFSHSIHNTLFGSVSNNYHKEKSELAEKHGYRCIHVWDWDRTKEVLNLLQSKNKIYARYCEVHSLDTVTADIFTSKNHLSGSCKGQFENYGLYYGGELVMVMTFGSPRYNKKYDFELLRLCSKSDMNIVGGASKLFRRFIQNNPGKSVISYCDASKFKGDVYEKLGMKYLYTSEPNVVWSKGKKYVTSNLLRQRGYDQLFGTSYGKGTSNEELMIENGWLPVCDCGQKVYVYKYSR